MTDETELLERLERAQSEQISHEVIGTDPIQVRIENKTPASRSDKTTHLVVVGDDWITSSSPDHLYRDVVDKYMLYLATQEEDLLLRERVRSVVDAIEWDDESDGSDQTKDSLSGAPAGWTDGESESGTDFPSDEPGRTSKGFGTTTIEDANEDDEESDRFSVFIDSLMN